LRCEEATWGVAGGNVLTQRQEGFEVKIALDRSKCAGHALCNAVAAELFPLDDEGYSVLQPQIVAERNEQPARDGVASCPETALRLTEGD
jgi:ferredoxin